MLIPKDRLAILINYLNVTKDQTLEETVLTFFHRVVHGCFQSLGATNYDAVKG